MKNKKSKKLKNVTIENKQNKYITKKFKRFKYKKIKVESKNSICRFYKHNSLIKCIMLILLLILICTTFEININNKYKITSDKWIVMTAFNPPSGSIINLEKNINNWKIVVIGTEKTDNTSWNIFSNSNKLIYLPIKEQNELKYKILKYLDNDSYCRKNIGYIFAIQHGAKEIYEIDENLKIDDLQFLDLELNDTYICYGKQNEQSMINPYFHFGESNIWPRGFFIKDISTDYNRSFYYAYSKQIKLKPLVYQGLINKIPDVDSIFLLTNGKTNENLNIAFSETYPLIYFPGNYVPINSKNTKYLYEIFPFLMLPLTINESISDIIRGYILERFVFSYGGMISFHNTKIYNENFAFNSSKLSEEKKLLFNLDKILEIIKSKKYYSIFDSPKKLLFQILSELIKNNILKDKEIHIYKTFLKDLSNIGYSFSHKFTFEIKNNYKEYTNISSEFNYYIPTNQNILKGNNKMKLIKHASSERIYNDILLIINYNREGFLYLNEYLEELYKKYFPNIAYLYPANLQSSASNIIICKESSNGFYSYRCIEKFYERYPNFKGYLLLNDDVYLKAWELQNLDFTVAWFYIFDAGGLNKKKWGHIKECNPLYKICDNNLEYKKNLTNFFGVYDIFYGFSDMYYVPQYYITSFIKLEKEMFDSKIFLECAIDNVFAIISAPKYYAIYSRALWGDDRKNVINVLHNEFQQISIHPIKFSSKELKDVVRKYNFFINANDF